MPVELMNTPMRPIRAAAEAVVGAGRLEPRLAALLTRGVRAFNGGVYFRSNLRANWHLGIGALGRTGHEALVNKLHLAEVTGTSDPDWPARCVGLGVLLGRRVIAEAARVSGLGIDVVVSVDPGDKDYPPCSTFRFYGRRDDPWITEDLDSYGEAVLVLRGSPP